MKRSASQNVKCELCNTECPGILYEKHLSGKKHAKKLKKFNTSMITFQVGQASQPVNNSCSSDVTRTTNLEAKKQKLMDGGTDVPWICAICNVPCDGEIALANHMTGKEHLAKINTEHVWCEVCKIRCPSFGDLNCHKLGKKHEKNLKLQNLNEVTDKFQNPKKVGLSVAYPPPPPDKSKEPEDKETKKPKVLKDSGAVGNCTVCSVMYNKAREKSSSAAVGRCTICNVTFYRSRAMTCHLSGREHAAMVKQKHGEEAAIGNGNANNGQLQSENGGDAQELVSSPIVENPVA